MSLSFLNLVLGSFLNFMISLGSIFNSWPHIRIKVWYVKSLRGNSISMKSGSGVSAHESLTPIHLYINQLLLTLGIPESTFPCVESFFRYLGITLCAIEFVYNLPRIHGAIEKLQNLQIGTQRDWSFSGLGS